MRTVLRNLVFGESARWHDRRLWLCDWGTGEVVYLPEAGRQEPVLHVDSFPLCIDWLPGGSLLVVAGGDGRVLRVEGDGSTAVHASLAELSPGPWNEIAATADGAAFVNAAPGLIAAISPDGSVRQVADGLGFPNGMLVTPGGTTLIVAESYGRRLTAFDITDGGGLANGRVWADLGEDNPDGICLDARGAIWYADVPHRRCRRVREGGEILQTVELDRGCFSCALSDGEQPELFVAAAEWRGRERMFETPRTGVVIAVDAPAARA